MLRVLVFPCGSEVALEIHRSLKYSNHIEVIGGSSVNDHGKFVFDEYIHNIPFIDSEEIVPTLKRIVIDHKIDAIYPAMDKVIAVLKFYEKEIGCKVISPDPETTAICLSKKRTYEILDDVLKVPKVYHNLADIEAYPVFFKPVVGYGSRGTYLAKDAEKAAAFLEEQNEIGTEVLMTEFLPGDEYTVDCFTNRRSELLFASGRKRNRITNGISVNTSPVKDRNDEFRSLADQINSKLSLRGAWFFQVKENIHGELVLLEVASRLGGSSALFRNMGVNFALLTVFDAFNYDVEVDANDYNIELDRALSNLYKIDYDYDEVYVDFDDCLVIKGSVNESLVAFLYQAINRGKRITLITRHAYVIAESLEKYRLGALFDKIVHITKEDEKYHYINNLKSIFIDDSFIERKKVKEAKNIPVFAPDMIESLYKL